MTLSVKCPSCGRQKARRACPALGQQICPTCCGTKRLVEIECPPDCGYLASAREHPPAAALRQQQRDFSALAHAMRDLSSRQSELLFLVFTFLNGYETPALQPIIDDDVAEAVGAIAATYETASRGVIYEHQPTSAPAARLASDLKPLLAEAGSRVGSSFDRDAAVVLRRVEEAVREMHREPAALQPRSGQDRRAFLGLLERVMTRKTSDHDVPAETASSSRLIVP